MKNIFILLVFLTSLFSYAQERPFCIVNATTNPGEDPTNEQLETLPQLGGNPDTRFINEWIWWMQPLNPNWPNNVPLNNMELSPTEPYGPVMEPINSIGYTQHYLYLNSLYRDVMLPEAGWELLSFNTGWYPDNTTAIDWLQNPSLKSVPFLLFYNKFTGIARVFFRYGNNTSPNASINFASIELYYENPENNISGILRLGNGLDRSLDEPTLVAKLLSRVPSPGQSELWFSSDFQLAFDPCVCDYASSFRMAFTFFTEANLEIFGTAITATNELSTENFMTDANYVHDFLSSSDYTMSTGNRNGALIYKTMSDMLADYEHRLKAYKEKLESVNQSNAEIDKIESLLKIADVVLTLGVTAVTGMPEYSSLLAFIPSIKAQKDKDTFGKDTQKAFWKELDKALGVGFELMVKDDLKKKTSPSKPIMPSVSFTEMHLSGSFTLDTQKITYPMSTPGSKESNQINTNQPSRYPLYDDPLGVFALLEKPKFNVSHSIKDEYSWEALSIDDIGMPPNNIESIFQSWTVDYQFKIAEPLKYYFNPSLDIVDYKIEAALELESSYSYQTAGGNHLKFSCFIDPNNTVNRASKLIDLDEFTPIKSIAKGFNNGHNYACWVPVPSNLAFEGIFCEEYLVPQTDFASINSISEFVPLDAFQNFYSSLAIKNQFFDQQFSSFYEDLEVEELNAGYILNHKLYLKLKISVTFEGTNADGDPNEFTYLFTYEVLPEDITYQTTDLYPNLAGSSADFTQYPENLLFDGTTFNGAIVDGCELNGNDYFCKAWNDIQISGNISIANNYNVIFEAGNEVAVLPTAIVPPSATLRLNSPFDFSNPMPQASPAYVSSFCNGENAQYQANTLRADILAYYDSIAVEEQNTIALENSFDASIFPNPSNGETQASITLPESALTSIKVIDMSGKVVSEPLTDALILKGKTVFNLMTDQLNAGIYFVNITVNGERRVLRLIKQ